MFHSETLEVAGVHRSGHVGPMRPDSPRARDDDVYEANESVSIRSVRDLLG